MRTKTQLQEMREIMERYEGWYIDSPEDSWGLERDIREVLGMPSVEWK